MPTTNINYSSTSDSTAITTFTIAALATSATLITGRQSDIVTNVTNKYNEVLVTGQVTTGSATLTAGTIAVYLFQPLKVATSTFTYPQAGTTALTESDAARTFDAEQRSGALTFMQAASTNTTADRPYSFAFSISERLGYVPLKWGLFVTHNTGQNLNATAGNHWFHYVGIKYDVA